MFRVPLCSNDGLHREIRTLLNRSAVGTFPPFERPVFIMVYKPSRGAPPIRRRCADGERGVATRGFVGAGECSA